jgi:divalent metal cation (Fe/Co/Zn/Cd) transporter
MHCLVDSHLTIEESHAISESIEEEIGRLLPGTVVVIQLEPDNPEQRAQKSLTSETSGRG